MYVLLEYFSALCAPHPKCVTAIAMCMCVSQVAFSMQQQPKGKYSFFNGGREMGFAILSADLLFVSGLIHLQFLSPWLPKVLSVHMYMVEKLLVSYL